ncbi:sugar transferase [Blastococcus saxobsidens]|uniref:Undecaprenyl-phosphate galactose phosphotransferase n=1 Tax=Blastococcus saxobsidens (strain DD2) TaxID=1146883 RepID=H6RN22_BLASD|nr:sugar transferase [Blastococcus saxobsidens]CCG01375.1 Undecaprenyl-phosphate galactose phosphotransferase [Blastococcus saxobsidens DD2]
MALTQSDQPSPVQGSPDGSRSRTLFGLGGPGAASQRTSWQGIYVRRILAGDALAGLTAAAAGYLIRFGPETATQGSHAASAWIAGLLPFVWVTAMLLARGYERRFLWIGPEEFRRVFSAAVFLLATVGTVSWAFKLEVARGFIVLALPLATLLTLGQRYAHRVWVHRQRSGGRFEQTMLIVGHGYGIAALHTQIDREAYHGYRVVGCCRPAGQAGQDDEIYGSLPVLGGLHEVAEVVRAHAVETVAVLPSPEMDGPALRRLGWALEDTQAELLLAPAITEIVGPRVNIRPVSGLPLLHMERPELRGVRRLTKEATDRTAAVAALLLLLPLLLVVAAAVRFTSQGPALFRQERVGRDGRVFHMLKFRTMVQGAHDMTASLAAQDEGNGVLFKLRSDPRVTRVGKVLRRYSVDELPQLFNVVRGEMSLVGPRPPLPSEVERYGVDMHRRFLVKPGLTGLWQISGRSDLSWDDSVRMDVRYVENWSLALDLMILWKTAGAVLRGSGAY